jgi:hypothetical protein
LAAILLYSVGALRANYYISFKPDYRGGLAYFTRHYQTDDCIIFAPGKGNELPLYWDFYRPDDSRVRADTVAQAIVPWRFSP